MGATHLLGQDQGAYSYFGNSKTFRLFHIIFIVFVECYEWREFSQQSSFWLSFHFLHGSYSMDVIVHGRAFRDFLRKIWWR